MSTSRISTQLRLSAALIGAVALSGCSDGVDFDLRGTVGGFSTEDAARAVQTADRPAPDSRGVISYPHYQVAVARRGDTVADVAARVGLPAEDLARFNGLNPGDPLRADEILALPRRVAEPSAATGAPGAVDIAALAGSAIDSAPDTSVSSQPLAPAPKSAPKPQEPVRHKVKRGETAYTISRLYQVPVDALAEWNGLGPDFTIREGQYLLIPVKTGEAPPAVAPVAVTAPGQGSPTPPPPSAAEPLPDEKIAATAPPPPPVSVGEPTRDASRMTMPVQGKIIRAYAKNESDGIDIAGTPGGAVVAAADGTVRAVTADADKVSIIVIDHGDNLLTVYANLDKITVGKGDKVKRGEQLASLRGGSDAYVHFEVRKGFDSVDPMPYLK